jgi:hypothetical protein
MTVYRSLLPLALFVALSVEAAAQGGFPAPLPNQSGDASPSPAPSPRKSSPDAFQKGAPPVGGGLDAGGFPPGQGRVTEPVEQKECRAKFAPLRQDAEQRAKLIRAASERKASANEGCILIKAYVAAEAKVVNYVTTNQTACNIPAEIQKQLRVNQSRSEQMMKTICQAAKDQLPFQFDQPPLERWRQLDPPPTDQQRFRVLQIMATFEPSAMAEAMP